MAPFTFFEGGDHSRNRPISTVQSRMGVVQDPMRRKLIDNTMIYNISDAVDCFRIKYRTTYEGDNISYIVEAADVISAIFPAMTDIPFRKIKVDQETRRWELTSLINAFEDDAQEKMYACSVPFEHDIDVGDMVIRIFLDPAQKYHAIIPLTIKELLGTFGHHMIIMQKCQCTIPTDIIPQEIIDCVQQMSERRRKLNF